MNLKNISHLSFAITILLLPTAAFAADKAAEPVPEAKTEEVVETVKFYEYDLVCESDISYSWTPLPPVTEEAKKEVKTEEKEVKMEKAAPISVFFSKAGAHGHLEADARRELAAKLPKIKLEALNFCAEKHQSQTSCINGGFKKVHSSYNEADYLIRKALLDSVIAGCQAGYGVCNSAENSEITCYENRPPELNPNEPPKEAAKAATKDEAKKDPKK